MFLALVRQLDRDAPRKVVNIVRCECNRESNDELGKSSQKLGWNRLRGVLEKRLHEWAHENANALAEYSDSAAEPADAQVFFSLFGKARASGKDERL